MTAVGSAGLALAAAAFGAFLAASGQELATVSGVVLEAGTRRPVAGARVLLISPVPGPNPMAHTVLAGEDGRFDVHRVKPGAYQIAAAKPPYATAFYREPAPGVSGGTTLVGAAGLSGVEILLAPGAVISGRVLDPFGAPAVWAQLLVRRMDAPASSQVWTGTPAVEFSTDDRGEYRVFGLAAGEYRVTTEMYRDSTGPLSATGGPSVAFVSDALTVSLLQGEERGGVEVRQRVTRLRKVSGVIANSGSESSGITTVRLTALSDAGVTGLYAVTSGRRFEIGAVPSGRYWLTARWQPPQNWNGSTSTKKPEPPPSALWAGTEVSVGDQDVADVVLDFVPMTAVRGRVVVLQPDGSPGSVPDGLRIELQWPHGWQPTTEVPSAAVDAAGGFTLTNVTPERQRIVARDRQHHNLAVEVVEMRGVRTHDGLVDVPAGTDLTDVIIVVRVRR